MKQAYDQLQVKGDKRSKGFSLIEVMIVIAILGILATISVVAFQHQRINAFNSAALTVLGTIAKHEESLFLDASAYGTTNTDSTAVAQGKGSLITGGAAAGYLVSSQNSSSNPQFREFWVSEGVSVVVAADSTYQSFVVTSKHASGDRRYCFDSESGKIYYDYTYVAGQALTWSGGLLHCPAANMTEL